VVGSVVHMDNTKKLCTQQIYVPPSTQKPPPLKILCIDILTQQGSSICYQDGLVKLPIELQHHIIFHLVSTNRLNNVWLNAFKEALNQLSTLNFSHITGITDEGLKDLLLYLKPNSTCFNGDGEDKERKKVQSPINETCSHTSFDETVKQDQDVSGDSNDTEDDNSGENSDQTESESEDEPMVQKSDPTQATLQIQQLTSLNLSYCPQLTDLGFKSLIALTNLQELDLSHTNITDKVITKLTALSKLQYLNIRGCELVGYSAVVSLLKGLDDIQTFLYDDRMLKPSYYQEPAKDSNSDDEDEQNERKLRYLLKNQYHYR